ncbi:MAG: hypothetical protein AAGG11_19440 [Pseudomonadota bacterium]
MPEHDKSGTRQAAAGADQGGAALGADRGAAEAAVYAEAAWQRFEAEIDDRLLRAVTGAFALIVAADGDLAAEEADRFLVMMHGRARLFPGLNFDAVAAVYRDLTSALLSDPEGGRAHALDSVAAVKDVAQHCELVLAAARIALSADHEERPAELSVLEDIRAALAL